MRLYLEARRAPVDELDRPLGLDGRDRRLDLLGRDIATVQQAGGHVLPFPRVALHHLVVGFEARHGDLLYGVGLVLRLCCGDDWSVSDEREMYAGIRN